MIELYEEKAGPEGEIMVSRTGAGPALVLIHGITSGRWSWDSVVEPFAQHFEVFIYDQRGHGSSHKPNRGYQLADYAADLDLVLDHFGLDEPLIMGHSLGGMVALEWAIGQPDRAKALVIEDSPMRRGGGDTDALFDGWLALNAMEPEDAEAAYLAKSPDMNPAEAKRRSLSITATVPGVLTEMRDASLAQAGAIVIESYRGITSPTMLVYGDLEAGGMVPVADAEAFAATLPNGSAINIPGGGHGLHMGRTDEFLNIVVPFLREHSA
jgi:pimeloyl-ACP methyl ester carboxylesterase